MAGKQFKVGQFAHSLRLRLMREHLGIDVDALSEDVCDSSELPKADNQKTCDPDVGEESRLKGIATHVGGDESGSKASSTINEARDGNDQGNLLYWSFMHIAKKVVQAFPKRPILLRLLSPKRSTPTQTCKRLSSNERKDTFEKRGEVTSLADSTIPSPRSASCEDAESGGRFKGNNITDNATEEGQHDDTGSTAHMSKILLEEPIDVAGDGGTMGGSTLRPRSSTRKDLRKSKSRIWTVPTHRPRIDPDIFEDPVADAFWKDVWVASAVHNVCIITIIHPITCIDG